MGLELYNKKRDFKQTPEPSTGKAKSSKKLTFVVQRHHASHLHYDFRLEMEGVLKSWAVPKGPSMKAGERRLAVHVEDHPLDYGKFYGEIPEGNYGAGIVEIWDNGTYTPLEPVAAGTAEKALLHQYHKGDLKFVLKGKHLAGAFALVRMNDGTDKNWLLIKKSDEHAQKSYAIAAIEPVKPFKAKTPKTPAKTSSRSKQKAAPKKADPEPEASDDKENVEDVWKFLQKPMLATLADPDNTPDGDWTYEAKYDGYRVLTKLHSGKAELVSRNGNPFNKHYAALLPELEQFEDELILDGEVVIEDSKRISNFQLLQNYTTTGKGTLRYYVFDLLYLNGHSIVHLPLHQRRELLEMVFKKTKLPHVHLSAVLKGKGPEILERLTKKGYEGIIAKDRESTYLPGKRTDAWRKLKKDQSGEAIICGYTQPKNSRKHFGSLLLGEYANGKLVYIGNCGSGFTDTTLRTLHQRFKQLETEEQPFAEKPILTGMKGKPTWLEPALVCNVKYSSRTADNHLRHPVFMGLREDKATHEVMKNNDAQPEVRAPRKKAAGNTDEKDQQLRLNGKVLQLTNRTKVYFPKEKITKGDIIDYYRSIANYILPYLKNRPQSLNRHPNGITKPGFYQKDINTDQVPEWLHTEEQYSKSNDANIDYLICNDAATLVYMANLGCIEINPWHSTFDQPDYPDYLIMDLDPGNIDFIHVVETANTIREICEELGVKCFCKTSGATGLHIYLPLKKQYTYDDVKLFGELLATVAQQRLPETTSIERAVAKRKDKIYIDFLQNRKGQTIAAAYSARPKPGATVSTPLEWSEVNDTLDPKAFTIDTIHARLAEKGDLWKGVLGRGINVEKALKKLARLLED